VDNQSKSVYCQQCKKDYPLTLLKLQTEYDLKVPELLIEIAKTFNFHSGEFIASVLKVPRKKFIEWLKLYVGIESWNEFKKEYYCKSSTCYIVDTDFFDITDNKYYLIHVLKKDLNVCSCIYKLSDYEKQQSRPRIIKNLMESKKGKTISKESTILIRIPNIETLEKIQIKIIASKIAKDKNEV
jgi:hypothetical protein